MNLSILVWLFPGYIATYFNHCIRPVRNQSGWDFVARTGFLSLIFYTISTLITYFLKKWNIVFLFDIFEFLELDESTKALPWAIILATIYGLLTKLKFIQNIIWLSGHIEPFTYFCRGVFYDKSFVILSMKNGKVYVGLLEAFTEDVNESHRFLSIGVDLSGYRNKDTHQVVFDKNYKKYGIPIDQRKILVPFSEISSIARFSEKLHEKLVEEKITLLGPQEKQK